MECPRTKKALELTFKVARKEVEDPTLLSKLLDKLLAVEEVLNSGREKQRSK